MRALETAVGLVLLALVYSGVGCLMEQAHVRSGSSMYAPPCAPEAHPTVLCGRVTRGLPRECAICPVDKFTVGSGCLSTTGVLCVEDCRDPRCVPR